MPWFTRPHLEDYGVQTFQNLLKIRLQLASVGWCHYCTGWYIYVWAGEPQGFLLYRDSWVESLSDGAGLGLLGIVVLDRAITAYFRRDTDPTALSRS